MRAAVLMLLLAGCAKSGAAKPNASAAAPDTTVSVPSFVRAASAATGEPASSAAPAPSVVALAESAAPLASASGAPSVAVPDVDAPPAPKSDGVLPDVEVKNVGLHIGGGPNDNVTKRPIREAVKLHFDGFRACYAKAISPKKADTFGVDLRIPGEGGVAKVSKPRTAMKGDGLVECMVEEFEKVEFSKPPKGVPMTVSFSVEFRKKK
ncbi:MAG: hypothetical protein FJ096_12115 [Deltaproteobacteria bacterium]|nr:hypothetical protein [Deltaproteobacteria bacterium]